MLEQPFDVSTSLALLVSLGAELLAVPSLRFFGRESYVELCSVGAGLLNQGQTWSTSRPGSGPFNLPLKIPPSCQTLRQQTSFHTFGFVPANLARSSTSLSCCDS